MINDKFLNLNLEPCRRICSSEFTRQMNFNSSVTCGMMMWLDPNKLYKCHSSN
jgi:hypothetical protein